MLAEALALTLTLCLPVPAKTGMVEGTWLRLCRFRFNSERGKEGVAAGWGTWLQLCRLTLNRQWIPRAAVRVLWMTRSRIQLRRLCVVEWTISIDNAIRLF